MNPTSIIGSIGLAVIVSLGAYGWIQNKRALHWQEEYYQFTADTQAAGKQAEADKILKEKENERRINDALRSRDVALSKLRDFQGASRGQLPGSPQTSGSPETICWTTDRFDSGLQELEGILIEGQIAVEERKSWLESWPQ